MITVPLKLVDLWQLCPLVRSWISFIVISRFQASEGE